MAVVVCVDLERGVLVSSPRIVSRGWVELPALLGHEAAVVSAGETGVRSALAGGDRDLFALEDLVMRTARRTSRDRTVAGL